MPLLEHGRFRHGDRLPLAHGPGAVPVAFPARADDAAMRRTDPALACSRNEGRLAASPQGRSD
ncbi:hypothetical protein CJO92_18270 (plasmid) [Ralstonia solanacearum]|uniref:Uncharacterized protein n=1 Tax=Ralstonia solanacearum TaxID=305 RepID=A0AAD0SG35_RALSL|nr:hypothetical protein CJO77_18270 [Ralstonia solanacearum]AXW54675.1 hypothetical protein CJO92_18270 [Ralstonia solanacearum]